MCYLVAVLHLAAVLRRLLCVVVVEAGSASACMVLLPTTQSCECTQHLGEPLYVEVLRRAGS
jgi:hypothetical protein